jgi:hypothetical protein
MKRREIVTLLGGAMARCKDDVADLLTLVRRRAGLPCQRRGLLNI